MNLKKRGKQSVIFYEKPRLIASAAIVGDMEGKGPLGAHFDIVLKDDTWGEESWEKAERRMFQESVNTAVNKCGILSNTINCLLGGDLLNQIISASFAARELEIPFLGLYGACSTMAESLLIGGMLIDGGFLTTCACVASSHFSTAERQYRFPLELGCSNPPSAQRTVTGAGCSILAATAFKEPQPCYKNIVLSGGTIGRVIDFGINDASNMGAAMAPAAANTLKAHFEDFSRSPDDYDLIITGDLGYLGSELFLELCRENGFDMNDKHMDCGKSIFFEKQKIDCGGSGCGCSASVLNGYLLKRIEVGDIKRALFMATGALLSPASSLQGETIPSIAHAVILERR
ncbi:MAG: stage V sporulation protein AD [Clostridia bacterium]